MKNYKQIQQEIARLERQAEKARKAELKGVIQQIKKTMSEHGITIDDLQTAGAGKARKSAGKATAKRKGGKVAAKYRSKTDASLTWTGRGRKPLWVQEWLDAGNEIDALLI